jgi:aryl-alcohol dehydrogenase-like predicted oxidoreductase
MAFGWTVDEQTAHDIMSVAFDMGINFIDTADVYSRWAGSEVGATETIIGKWLKTKPRDKIIIATKVGGRTGDGPTDRGLSTQHITQAVEASLRRLQIDTIDLYQAHRPDDKTPIEETLRAFDDLLRQGKVRYIGAANFPADKLASALRVSRESGRARFESLQVNYNLVHRDELEDDLMSLCADQGLGVLAYHPRAGGLLTDRYRQQPPPLEDVLHKPGGEAHSYLTDNTLALIGKLDGMARVRGGKTAAQIALALVLANPVVTSLVIGVRTIRQLQEDLGVVGVRLTTEEKKVLDEMTAES